MSTPQEPTPPPANEPPAATPPAPTPPAPAPTTTASSTEEELDPDSPIKPAMTEQEIRDAGLAIDLPYESGPGRDGPIRYAEGSGEDWQGEPGWEDRVAAGVVAATPENLDPGPEGEAPPVAPGEPAPPE